MAENNFDVTSLPENLAITDLLKMIIKTTILTKDEEGNFHLDTDKFNQFADRYGKTENKQNSENAQESINWGLRTKHAMRMLVESGIVSPKLALFVGRNFRPSAIIHQPGKGIGIQLDDHTLYRVPTAEDEENKIPTMFATRDRLIMGNDIEKQVTSLKHVLQTSSIDAHAHEIDDQELGELSVAAHEYGHLIHNALARAMTEDLIEKSPTPPNSLTGNMIRSEAEISWYEISRDVNKLDPLPSSLPYIDNAKSFRYSSDSYGIERIGRGFESAMIGLYLEKHGVPNEKIVKVMEERRFHNLYQDKPFIHTYAYLQSIGYDYVSVIGFLRRSPACHTEQGVQILHKIPEPVDVGYKYGLSRNNLVKWLNQYAPLIDRAYEKVANPQWDYSE